MAVFSLCVFLTHGEGTIVEWRNHVTEALYIPNSFESHNSKTYPKAVYSWDISLTTQTLHTAPQ
jgi:hypothetical protein